MNYYLQSSQTIIKLNDVDKIDMLTTKAKSTHESVSKVQKFSFLKKVYFDMNRYPSVVVLINTWLYCQAVISLQLKVEFSTCYFN